LFILFYLNILMSSATLNQGLMFKKYQKKIINQTNPLKSKKNENSNVLSGKEGVLSGKEGVLSGKEGFETGDETAQFAEIKVLQDKLEQLLAEYRSKQDNLINKTQEYTQITSSNNRYANRNIRFTTGHVCYVTNSGVIKYIPSPEIWDSFAGKYGCPGKDYVDIGLPWLPEYNNIGAIVPTNPPLIIGTYMTANQACGNAGNNVFVNDMLFNAQEKYFGCYRDKPESQLISAIPVLTVANSYSPQNWEAAWNQPGYSCTTSSIYLSNNDANGPYKAFDKNIGNFWHSEVSAANNYNGNTGVYEGSVSFQYEKSPGVFDTIRGEWVWIKLDSPKVITSYDLVARQDAYSYRSPNSWSIMGLNPGENWHVLDTQANIDFSTSAKRFNISNPGNYLAYLICITKVGNASSENSGNRYCVQIAEWDLFTSSDSTFTNDNRAMSLTNGGDYVSDPIETCKKRAMDGGYKYFGIQNIQANGTAQCLVSNDSYRTKIYGEAFNTTVVPLWSSGTTGKAVSGAYLTNDGRFLITEAGTGAILWTSPNNPSSCWWGGKTNPDSIQGSYGGNCVGRPKEIDCGRPQSTSYPADGLAGNMNSVLRDFAYQNATNNNTIFTVNAQTAYSKTGLPADPAVCCAKQYQYAYQCGGGPFKTGANVSESGGVMTFDCSAESAACSFRLELQDDANMCIYQDNVGPAIWCTMTNDRGLENNPNWAASKGKYGVPRLTTGQVLGPNEWIASTNGLIMLIMQTDGNLVLYSSSTKINCSEQNGKSFGGPWANAVYELSEQGFPGNMSKIGYVDSNNVLSEYPADMIKKTNQYRMLPNTDSGGNDFGGMPMQNSNVDQCKSACTDNDNCAGFVFDRSNNNCWLKDQNVFPKSARQINNNLDLYLRQPKINNNSSCSNNIKPIDSVTWNRYSKSGRNMTMDTTCGLAKVTQPSIESSNALKTQIAELAQEIVNKMNNLGTSNAQLNSEMETNRTQILGDVNKYKEINEEFSKHSATYATNISGILNETDQIVLHENYSYMFWSILAIGIIIIIINMKKK
jgi:PAN domain